MRPFRVFNRVGRVTSIWKFAGMKLRRIGQIAVLVLLAVVVALLKAGDFLTAGGVFVIGFAALELYTYILDELDPEELFSEMSTLRAFFRGTCHRHTTNFDIPKD